MRKIKIKIKLEITDGFSIFIDITLYHGPLELL